MFVYPAATNRVSFGPRVFAIGNPTDVGNGETAMWTMTDGHLTQVTKLVQGSGESVIAIDPARPTCTFELRRHPDPQTGLTVGHSASGTIQVQSANVVAYSCTVTKGNVFAP